MGKEVNIPEPILFSPLKHYLPFIREFAGNLSLSINDPGLKELTRELKHIGTCVMDIYKGELSQEKVSGEILDFLKTLELLIFVLKKCLKSLSQMKVV